MHVRWFASEDNPGAPVEGTYVDHASHAKYASADSQVMVLGSQNMDTQSWQTSRELSVAIDDPGVTEAFDSAFQTVWERSVCAYECNGCGAQTDPGPEANWVTVGCFAGEGTGNPQPIIDRCEAAVGSMASGALSDLGAPILCGDVLADKCYLTADCPEGATTFCIDQVGECIQASLLNCPSP